MILGQLFYYQKKVKEFSENLSPESVSEIEIFGLNEISSNDYLGMGRHEIARSLKDKFSLAYLKLLKENRLNFAAKFWENLTSPLLSSKSVLRPSTEYQQILVQWSKKDLSFDNFDDILFQGYLTNEEEDYACFYGLSVLNELTLSKSSSDSLDFSQEGVSNDLDRSNFSEKPQVLVLCDNYVSPLFKNLNCEISPIAKDPEVNLKNVKQKIKENSKISLILLVGKETEESLSLLQRKLSDDMLVSALDLDEDSSGKKDTYFDRLVKDTLGVRLT